MYLDTYKIFFNPISYGHSVLGNNQDLEITSTITSSVLKLYSSYKDPYLLAEFSQIGWTQLVLMSIRYYSSWTILDQQLLDYNNHCTILFGALVQENNDNKPEKPKFLRTIDVICLQSLDKIQGGREIFYLHINRVILNQDCWYRPLTI